MSTAFTLIWIAGIMTGACIFFNILYSAYKITEAKSSEKIMDVPFPVSTERINKKTVSSHADLYQRTSSNARMAMGNFYSDNNIETMRKKSSPQNLPKGRYSK